MATQKHVFATLQAGRGIAAMLVVVYHSGGVLSLGKYWNYRGFNYTHFGYSGVEYFFVLSGIVILLAHWDDIGRPSAFKAYFWKRSRRIYPIYWVILFCLLPVYFLVPSFGEAFTRHLGPWFDSLILLPVFGTDTILPTAWTLFHEIMFYLVFAVFIVNRRLGAIVLSCWIACSIACCFVYPTSTIIAAYLSPLHLLFALGMLAAILVRSLTLPAWPLIAAGIGGFVACAVLDDLYRPESVMWPLSFGVFAAIAAVGLMYLERSRTVRIPRSLLFLGNASYSVYLVHYAALSVAAKVLYHVGYLSVTALVVPFALLVITSTAAGLLVHAWIEQPLLKRLPR